MHSLILLTKLFRARTLLVSNKTHSQEAIRVDGYHDENQEGSSKLFTPYLVINIQPSLSNIGTFYDRFLIEHG